jgi:hypothetical protein
MQLVLVKEGGGVDEEGNQVLSDNADVGRGPPLRRS